MHSKSIIQKGEGGQKFVCGKLIHPLLKITEVICPTRKSLYGLKQAPKQWYEKFDQTLVSDGYVVNSFDTCVYSKLIELECVIICLYVDEMLIFGTNVTMVNEATRKRVFKDFIILFFLCYRKIEEVE